MDHLEDELLALIIRYADAEGWSCKKRLWANPPRSRLIENNPAATARQINQMFWSFVGIMTICLQSTRPQSIRLLLVTWPTRLLTLDLVNSSPSTKNSTKKTECSQDCLVGLQYLTLNITVRLSFKTVQCSWGFKGAMAPCKNLMKYE